MEKKIITKTIEDSIVTAIEKASTNLFGDIDCVAKSLNDGNDVTDDGTKYWLDLALQDSYDYQTLTNKLTAEVIMPYVKENGGTGNNANWNLSFNTKKVDIEFEAGEWNEPDPTRIEVERDIVDAIRKESTLFDVYGKVAVYLTSTGRIGTTPKHIIDSVRDCQANARRQFIALQDKISNEIIKPFLVEHPEYENKTWNLNYATGVISFT